jgi:hypothetical protein
MPNFRKNLLWLAKGYFDLVSGHEKTDPRRTLTIMTAGHQHFVTGKAMLNICIICTILSFTAFTRKWEKHIISNLILH